MKISKSAKKLAKEILSVCDEGKVDEIKLEKFTKILSTSKEHLAVEILSELDWLLTKSQLEQTLGIESAFPLEEEQVQSIKQEFEAREKIKLVTETSINKSLISGVRISLGDNVWEHSVAGSLKQMKGNFNYE